MFLNLDAGELPDEPDELWALFDVLNVACGGHAGDPVSMQRAARFCASHAIGLGAHPSYADRAGFGRRSLAIATAALHASVGDQCAQLAEIARSCGVGVGWVKPHGALYHDAAASEPIARAVVEGAIVGAEPRRVAYLAIRGGVDAPVVLGSRSTQPSAGIGQRIRAGDRISIEDTAEVAAPVARFVDDPRAIRVIAGPDLDAFAPGALERLAASEYRILPASDRVGTRLDGPALIRRPEYPEESRPMVCGAIEVPRDGRPIVLGPEHPTIGGYPIVAVIARAELGRFFALRPTTAVRFTV